MSYDFKTDITYTLKIGAIADITSNCFGGLEMIENHCMIPYIPQFQVSDYKEDVNGELYIKINQSEHSKKLL